MVTHILMLKLCAKLQKIREIQKFFCIIEKKVVLLRLIKVIGYWL